MSKLESEARWCAQRRVRTRERQIRSLRARRLGVIPKDPKVQSVLRHGWAELERLEARAVPMTRIEVAAQLGLSVEGVRLIELRALAKVRAALGIQEAT